MKYWFFILSLIFLCSCSDQEESSLDITMTEDELINSIDADVEQELVDYDFLVKDTILNDSMIQ
ncbi:MAG: hypothetical protein ACI9J3_001743 [Parvicellaceae bacterium]|jgi:hypothetical protein